MSENPYFRASLSSPTENAAVASSLTLEERAILAARASLFLQSQNQTSTTHTLASSVASSLSPPSVTSSLTSISGLGGINPSALSQLYNLGGNRLPGSGGGISSATTGSPSAPHVPFNLPLHLWSQWAALHGISQFNATLLAHQASVSSSSISTTPTVSVCGGGSSPTVGTAPQQTPSEGNVSGGGVRLPRPVYPPPITSGIPHRFAPYFYPKSSISPSIPIRPGSPETLRPPPDGSPGHS